MHPCSHVATSLSKCSNRSQDSSSPARFFQFWWAFVASVSYSCHVIVWLDISVKEQLNNCWVKKNERTYLFTNTGPLATTAAKVSHTENLWEILNLHARQQYPPRLYQMREYMVEVWCYFPPPEFQKLENQCHCSADMWRFNHKLWFLYAVFFLRIHIKS